MQHDRRDLSLLPTKTALAHVVVRSVNPAKVQLKDVKLKDRDLTFSAVRVFMDNKIPIDYKLTINGDKLKGKGASAFGGKKQEFDIEGKREKNDK